MSKQDRQGVRTAADIETKYNLGSLGDSGAGSKKLEAQLRQLTQTVNQYMAATSAAIAEISSQKIVARTKGTDVVLNDSAHSSIISLVVFGPAEVSKVYTSGENGEQTEAVLSAVVMLGEGDKLSAEGIERSDGTLVGLPEVDKVALRGLKTFKPTTHIHVEGAAFVEVEYVADLKLYIDNKVAAQGGEGDV